MKNITVKIIPNVLSTYRLIILPVICWTLLTSQEEIFILLICVNLITDVLDGFLARVLKCCTELGARLDSLADIGTFLASFIGFWVFKPAFLTAHAFEFLLLLSLYAGGQIFSLIKFKSPTSFHLYSNKLAGYFQGIFLFTFFLWGYYPVLFYSMLLLSYWAETEVILTVLFLKKKVSNIPTVFHVFKR